MPLEWSAHARRRSSRAIAQDAPRGTYPRGILGRAVVLDRGGRGRRPRARGCSARTARSRPGTGAFSIEPFLFARRPAASPGPTSTATPSLEDGYLPIPSVRWRARTTCELDRRPRFADGRGPARSSLVGALPRAQRRARRRAQAHALPGAAALPGEPAVAVPEHARRRRAAARALRATAGCVRVNGDRGRRQPDARPTASARPTSTQGDIVADYLRDGRLPPRTARHRPARRTPRARSPTALELAPGAEREVDLVDPAARPPAGRRPSATGGAGGARRRRPRLAACREALARAARPRRASRLPEAAADVARALEAQLGWILVNRDGAGIQPGSRSYARSWIRDGCAHLRGAAAARATPRSCGEFIEWFAPLPVRRTARCPAAWTRAAPTRCPSTTATASSSTWWPSTTATPATARWSSGMWPRVARGRGVPGLAAAAAAHARVARAGEGASSSACCRRRSATRATRPSRCTRTGTTSSPCAASRTRRTWPACSAARRTRARLARDPRRVRSATWPPRSRGHDAAHGIDYVPAAPTSATSTPPRPPSRSTRCRPTDVLPRARARAHLRALLGVLPRRAATARSRGRPSRPTRCAPSAPSCGWAGASGPTACSTFFLRYRRPPGWQQWAEVVWHDERDAALHRRPAAHLGGLGLRALGARHVRLRARAGQHAGDRGRRAGGLGHGAARPHAAGALHVPRAAELHAARARPAAIEARIEAGLRVPPGGIVLRAPGSFRRATVNGSPAEIGPAGEVVLRALPATVVLRP